MSARGRKQNEETSNEQSDADSERNERPSEDLFVGPMSVLPDDVSWIGSILDVFEVEEVISNQIEIVGELLSLFRSHSQLRVCLFFRIGFG